MNNCLEYLLLYSKIIEEFVFEGFGLSSGGEILVLDFFGVEFESVFGEFEFFFD